MRKTGLYGFSGSNATVDFEWPKENDLLQMPMNAPIKVEDLLYKNWKKDEKRFGGFQLILSNGISSPVFTSKDQTDQNLKSINI